MKTAFEFDGRIYEWNSMVMGYKNSPQILQRVINKVLEGELGKGVEAYLDDIIIHANTLSEHNKLLQIVLDKLIKNNLKINLEKIQLAKSEVKLLGVYVNGTELKPSESKINELLLYEKPKTMKDLRRFLGIANWVRCFIPKFADLTYKMTESLKKIRGNWEWSEELEDEFNTFKKNLENIDEIILPDYKKKFILKTDASNSGIGAVLLQEFDGELKPIVWASKKLTECERKYGITEKEMLAVYWGVKKFEYELRGRKFTILSDHKALEEIRKKAEFKNNRINRWIENIQEFDFDIKYVNPNEIKDADLLSREFETEEEINKRLIRETRGNKIKEGKIMKHLIIQNGVKLWKFDNNETRIVPEIEERKSLCLEAHNKMNHRGVLPTYYTMRKEYYWPGMKQTIKNICRKCEKCCIYNRKIKGGSEFVETRRVLEKVALDLLDIRSEKCYILIGIDYFTRYAFARKINDKKTSTIIAILNEWIKDFVPEEFITDNGKEFSSEEFRIFCINKRIEHRKVSIESHRSNGRIERLLRTIRETLAKNEISDLESNIIKTIKEYNNTYHSAIGCTPEEAKNNEDFSDLIVRNSKFSDYAKRFKKGFRDKFSLNEKVRIKKNENLGADCKGIKSRYIIGGKIFEVLENDSYLVKTDEGKIIKKRHYDIKRVYEET